jgi:hypothetical protein
VVEHAAGEVDETPNVDGDLLLPLLAWLLNEQAVDRPAGAVDKHVDGAEFLERGLNGIPHRCRVGHVGAPGEDPVGVLVDQFLSLGLVDVGHAHARALLHEAKCDGASDVGRPARDQHALAGELEIHRLFRPPAPG